MESCAACHAQREMYGDGMTYDGIFRSGLPHGFGKGKWKNGESYIGQWNNGQKEGYGIQCDASNRIIREGWWEQNAPTVVR